MNGDPRTFGWPLNHHPADAGLRKPLLKVLAQLQVLMQQAGIALVGIPARIPGAIDTEPQPDRIDFLAHGSGSLLAFADDDGQFRPRFEDPGGATTRPGGETLHDKALADGR